MLRQLIDRIIDIAARGPKQRRLVKFTIFLLIVSPIILISLFSSVRTRRDLTDLIFSRRESIAQLAAFSLEGRFDRLVDIGISLATRVQFRKLIREGKWDEAVQILKAVPQDFPFIERVFLTDLTGTLMADTPPLPDVRGKNFAFRDWYKGVSANWQPYISEVYKRAAKPQLSVVAVAIPIKADDGQILGILVMQVLTDRLLEWAQQIDVGLGGFVYFVDQRGHGVAHPKFPSQGEIADFTSIPVVQKVLRGENGVETAFNPVEKEDQLAAYHVTVKKYGWGAIAQQSTGTAFASRDQYLQLLIRIYGVIFLLHSGLAYLIVRLGDTIFEYRLKEKSLLDSIGDGIIAIDRSWNIIAWNKAATALTRWTKEEALGKPFREIVKFVWERDRKENITFIEETMLYGKPHPMTNNTLLVRKDGSELYVGDLAAPVFSNDAVIGAIIVFRDVSQEKALEQTRDEFASLATHQLRAPVNVIKGYVELLLDGQPTQEQRQHLIEIKTANSRLLGLVNAMLNVSRLELGQLAIEPEPTHLPDLADAVIKELRPQIEQKKLVLNKNYAPGLPSINADPKLTRAILQNLLINAITYTPAGGQISLTLEKQRLDILIKVSDTGIGIPKAEQAKLFTKLFRADNARQISPEGTGLGLYIVKSVIEQAGGKIWFESEENKGTTFFVMIPLEGMKKREGAKGIT